MGIEWGINGKRRYTYNIDNPIPDPSLSNGMRLHLNFWVPNSDWGWAFNQSLQPSSSEPGDEWHYYVENASVYYWVGSLDDLKNDLGLR